MAPQEKRTPTNPLVKPSGGGKHGISHRFEVESTAIRSPQEIVLRINRMSLRRGWHSIVGRRSREQCGG